MASGQIYRQKEMLSIAAASSAGNKKLNQSQWTADEISNAPELTMDSVQRTKAL